MNNDQTPSSQSSDHPLRVAPTSPQLAHSQPFPPSYRESVFFPNNTSAPPSKSPPSKKRRIRRRSTKNSSPTSSNSLKHRPISRIKNLTVDQLDQLAAWHLHQGLSIEACANRATAEFNPPRPVPKTSVQRFFEHRKTFNPAANPLFPPTPNLNPNPPSPMKNENCSMLDAQWNSPSASSALNPDPTSISTASPESLRAAAAELNFYAATASVNFSPATLHLLEQKAFELTQNFQCLNSQNPQQLHQLNQHLAPLKNLWLLIHKAKSTAIRERHASVQEQKCTLRRDEHQLRQAQLDQRDRHHQQKLDLDREKFELQKQQAQKTQPNTPGGTSYASPASSSLCLSASVVDPFPKSETPNDPHAHIKGDNYLDPTNKKVWVLATDTPALPFTDTAMEHRDRRNPLPPVDHSVTAAVQDFTDRVAQDYIQYLADPPRPQRPNSPTEYDYYRKRVRGCPCGQPKFCDRHIFIALFSYAHPWSHAFRQLLLDRGLPYVPPTLPFPGNKPNI